MVGRLLFLVGVTSIVGHVIGRVCKSIRFRSAEPVFVDERDEYNVRLADLFGDY